MTAYHHGEDFLYDSLFTGSLTPSTEEQLVRLYQPAVRNNCLMVTAVSVQQQKGGVDCGLFSIAAAYHSAVGDDFRGLTFSQNDMRQHLVECFERKQLSAFPQTSGAVARNARKHLFAHSL